MKVLCRHGHYAFYPKDRSEVLRFGRLFDIQLFGEADYFTLEGLVDLPRWSQAGMEYGNLPAVLTYEGRHASDVMRVNGFVYSLETGLLVPLTAVAQTLTLKGSRDAALVTRPFVQAGAVLDDGAGILVGFSGELDLEYQRLYIYERELL